MSNTELRDAVERLHSIKTAMKRLEEEAAQCQAVINRHADAGEDIPTITYEGVEYRAKVVASERMTVDADIYKMLLPELYATTVKEVVDPKAVMRLVDNGDISPNQAAKFMRLKKSRSYTRFERVTTEEGNSTDE